MAEQPIIQLEMNDAVRQWAEVAIDKFHQALDEYEVGKLDGELWRSLQFELVKAGGDIEKVVIRFKQYGRFVDMRVGRGVPIGKRGTSSFEQAREANGRLKRYGRKKKPWYSKTKTREVGFLRFLLVKKFGQQSLAEIEKSFTGTEYINNA